MKVSIITAVINGVETIEDCIKSALNQSYKDVEYVIIDGNSTDGTLDVINRYKDKIAKVVYEPDKGIYDALNKGIKLATGDIIGFLHSDDFYANDRIIEKVADVFMKYNVDSCYGDLQYVDKSNTNRVIRYWKSSKYEHGKFKYGWMPPHPTFFVKREIYDKYGYFNTDFRIAADYELMLRFLERHRISTYYIPEVLIKMRIGERVTETLKTL
jgi:glycosyltransferase